MVVTTPGGDTVTDPAADNDNSGGGGSAPAGWMGAGGGSSDDNDPEPDPDPTGDVSEDSTDSVTSTTPEHREGESPGVDADAGGSDDPRLADSEDTNDNEGSVITERGDVSDPRGPDSGPDHDPENPDQVTERGPNSGAPDDDRADSDEVYLPGTNISMELWRNMSTDDEGNSPGGSGAGTHNDAVDPDDPVDGTNDDSDGTHDDSGLANQPADENPNSPVGNNDLTPDVEVPEFPGWPELPQPENPFDSGPIGWMVDNLEYVFLFVVGLVTLYLARPLLEIGAEVSE